MPDRPLTADSRAQTTAYPLPRPVAIVRARLSVKSKMSWSETFLKLLKDNDVRLITYVPDSVLTPLIAGVNADNARIRSNGYRERRVYGGAPWRGDDADVGLCADR